MKTQKSLSLFFLASLLAPLAAFALPSPDLGTDLEATCEKIRGPGDLSWWADQCLYLGSKEAHFDPRALAVCGRLQDNRGNLVVFPCVAAIRDKDFTDDDLITCNGSSDSLAAVTCFRMYGRRHRSPANTHSCRGQTNETGDDSDGDNGVSLSIGHLQQQIGIAKRDVDNYLNDDADRVFNRILSDLKTASSVSCGE